MHIKDNLDGCIHAARSHSVHYTTHAQYFGFWISHADKLSNCRIKPHAVHNMACIMIPNNSTRQFMTPCSLSITIQLPCCYITATSRHFSFAASLFVGSMINNNMVCACISICVYGLVLCVMP